MEPVLRGGGSLLGECELLRPRIADEALLRKGGERMFRGVVRAAVLAAVIALLSAGAALADAGGQGTVTITEHAHNVTLFSDPVTNPCTGEPGTLTAIAANEVFHVTFFTVSDEFWVTGTDQGTVTFTPDDPNGVSASGHFAAWFGEPMNNKNDVQHNTNTFVLAGSDGSRLVMHETSHLSTNANGVVTVNFDNISLTCG